MKTRLRVGRVLIAALFFLCSPAWGEAEHPSGADKAIKVASAGPKAVIEETFFDFGKVTQGETFSHEFKIVNKGTGPLKIKDVKPD